MNAEIKKRFGIIFSIFLLALLLSSCSGGGFGSRRDVDLQKNYRQGYDGVDMRFSRNNQLDSIPQESRINIAVDLHNAGGYDLENGVISFSYDGNYLSLSGGTQRTFKLHGKSPFSPKGEERTLIFEGRTLSISPHAEMSFPFFIHACFPYKAILEDIICIDSPFRRSDGLTKDVCTFKNSISYGGQGGPVGISSIDIKFFSDGDNDHGRPVFDINFVHRGNGLITDPTNPLGRCQGRGLDSLKNNVVKIVNVEVSEKKLECNTYEVKMDGGKGRVTCEFLEPIPNYMLPFETYIYVEIDYGYMIEQRTSIGITR